MIEVTGLKSRYLNINEAKKQTNHKPEGCVTMAVVNRSSFHLPLSTSAPLSVLEKEQLRSSAKLVFHQLKEASQQTQDVDLTKIPSWIHSNGDENGSNDDVVTDNDNSTYKKFLQQRSETCHYFDMYGFCVQREFCSAKEVFDLKEEMKRLVQEQWHPDKARERDENGPDYAFATDAKSNTQRGDYFLDSADKVSYFAEPQALDECTGKLKEEYYFNKMAALNKAGHGMHTIPNSAFSKYSLCDKLANLVHQLGWQQPVIPQSMYIFKQPSIGGTVHSHQDSTFLYTSPKQSCLGLWLALDDATLDNGCLWVRPKSHLEPVRRHFIRNPNYFNQKNDTSDNNTGESTTITKLVFEECNPSPTHVKWEGGLPESVQVLLPNKDDTSTIFNSFLPVEVKAGDLVVFCGTLDHFSLPNFSNLPRHTFQLHLVEGPDAGVTWSPKNWLQYPRNTPFLKLAK
jgi:phytanoyl-CoA hydroxylase